jgi:hypothetical protein
MGAPQSPVSLEKAWRTANLVWLGSLAVAGLVWIGLPLLGAREAEQDDYLRLVTVLLYAVALADLWMGWWFKKRALNLAQYGTVRAIEEAIGLLSGWSLIAAFMPNTATVFAVVVYVLSGSLWAFSGLCALGVIGLFVLRPRLEEWQDTLRGIRVGADRSA